MSKELTLQEKLDRLEKREGVTASPAPAAPPKERIGANLDFWPEAIAAMPTELTRVSLFGLPTDKRGARKMLRAVKLDSRNDVEVLYTGEQLSAKEETLWLAALRLGRGVPMGQRIYLNIADLLREMRLTNTGGKRGNRQAVMTRLDRLSAAHFKVNFKRGNKTFSVTTGMLKWGIEHETGEMYIRLDPDGAQLFENLAYQPWEVRLSLQSDVSARLLTYIAGHQQGRTHTVRLDDLRRWCGYEGVLRKFRTGVLAAFAELEAKGVLVKGSAKLGGAGRFEMATWTRAKIAEESPPLPAPDPL